MIEGAEITVRPFTASDLLPTAKIFFRAVHIGAAAFYSEEQRNAWASNLPEPEPWAERLRAQTVLVAAAAEDQEVPIGFMSMTEAGLVDLAFVDPAWARRGVGGLLHAAILNAARANGLKILRTEASLAARPFFERQGWAVDAEQTVRRNEVALTNFRMSLPLSG